MAEDYIPISKARAEIANLTKLAQTQMQRYVLTHQGIPQAVLLGYEDYRSLKAAADLAHRPEVIENILSGQSQIREGKTIPLTDVKRRAKTDAKRVYGGVFIVSDRGGLYSQQELESKFEDMGLHLEIQKRETLKPVFVDLENPAALASERSRGFPIGRRQKLIKKGQR
jgi:prevent-host-death family protein